MNNELCRLTGAEFPLFAFSHCRDVVAAVSRAGGFGVLGGNSFTPESLKVELEWIDAHVDGKPYGVDILIPENQPISGAMTIEDLAARIPEGHIDFTIRLLEKYGIKLERENAISLRRPSTMPDVGEALMEVAFEHPIRLIANALGIAPPGNCAKSRCWRRAGS